MNNGKSILKQIKHDARFFERFYIKPCPFAEVKLLLKRVFIQEMKKDICTIQ